MARTVKILSEDPIPYVVDIENNRSDPDPFVCWFVPASHADVRAMDEAQLKESMSKKGVKVAIEAISKRRDRLIAKYVRKVEGYAVQRLDGSILTPTNGSELVEAMERVGAEEAETVKAQLERIIVDASQADEGLLGNLKSSPPSS